MSNASKRSLPQYFKTILSSTSEDCRDAQSSHSWLRSHFAYERTAESAPFFQLLDSLNERQLSALKMLRDGHNLFLTGCAGTGKTLWMRAAIATMQAMGKSVAVCATTAQAASNIEVLAVEQLPPLEEPQRSEIVTKQDMQTAKRRKNATKTVTASSRSTTTRKKFKKRKIFEVTPRTLHSWAGIGIEDFDPLVLAEQFLTQPKYIYSLNRWRYTETLFMDEVSMLSPKLFDALDKLGRYVRKNANPFGGIQVVIVADFFQLPPVLKNSEQQRLQQRMLQEQNDPDLLREQQEERERAAMERELAQQSDDNDEDDDDDDEEEKDDSGVLQQFEQSRRQAHQHESSKKPLSQEESLLEPVSVDRARCCFQTLAWHETVTASIVLNQVFRQNNPIFIDLLCELRRGIVSPPNIERLEMRTRYRLTNDLLNIAHRLFGGRNCERLRAMAARIFAAARSNDLSTVSLFDAANIDTTVNMAAPQSNTILVPNWKRFEKHVLQSAAQQEFDCDTALIYLLPEEHVPASHLILVSEIEPTHIMSLVAQVDLCNAQKLAAIKSPAVVFSAGVSIGANSKNPSFHAAQEHFAKEFGKNVTPLLLRLKVGAQVLLTCNIAPRFYNGRRGVVIAFMKREDFQSAYEDGVLLGQQCSDDDDEKYPIVRFDNGAVARVGRHSWERRRSFAAGAKPIIATLSQFPLALAFAITIHKSQGMTIGRLSVNLTRAFECGLPYVALSRGINLDSIVIEQMDRSIFDGSQPKLLPPAVVVAFYDKLEKEMEAMRICNVSVAQ